MVQSNADKQQDVIIGLVLAKCEVLSEGWIQTETRVLISFHHCSHVLTVDKNGLKLLILSN